MSRKLKVIGLSLVAVCALGAASASAQASQFTVASGSGAIATSTVVTSTTLELTVTGLLNLTCSGLAVLADHPRLLIRDQASVAARQRPTHSRQPDLMRRSSSKTRPCGVCPSP